jgi:Ca2+-binding RTX toxin-like protein
VRVVVAVGVLLAFPAAACAGTASIKIVPGPCDIVCSKYQGSGTPQAQFRYVAAPGEANAVTVSLQDRTVTLRDGGATVTPGESCTRVDDHVVTCTASLAPAGYGVTLDDGDDTAALEGVGGVLDGGPGDDGLTGGDSSDVLRGGGGRDRLVGNGGGDSLSDGDVPGGGDADVLEGGPGPDSVDYSARTAGVTVDLDAGAGPDGDALSAIETVTTGRGDDVVTGDESGNAIATGAGDDRLSGGAGDDSLAGGSGRDLYAGGSGDDTFTTRDGTGDSLTCGAGRDVISDLAEGSEDEYGDHLSYTVGPDVADVLALDCERTVFGARFDVDGTGADAPPRVVGRHRLVLHTPCRCRGTVTVRTALTTLGSARFSAGRRLVSVRSPRRRFEGVVELRWRVGTRTGAWSVALPGPK